MQSDAKLASVRYLANPYRFSTGLRMLALLFAFALVVSAIKFTATRSWSAKEASDGSPKHLTIRFIAGGGLLSLLVVCPFVWFARRRIELDLDEHTGTLLIRTRQLFRQVGLAGFSEVKLMGVGRWSLTGGLRVLLVFSDGRVEPVVDLPLQGAENQTNGILDAIFTMAERVPTNAMSVGIVPTLRCQGVDGEVLAHELVVDGKPLAVDDFGPLDLSEVGRSIDADGVYFIWTCTCGDPGCGGNFSGVRVEHTSTLVKWSDRDIRRRFAFRIEELRSAFNEAITKGREIVGAKPELAVIPEQNRDVLIAASK